MMATGANNAQEVFGRTGESTAYDSVWAAGRHVQESGALERAMLADDKLYVVLAVVLIIWFGVIFILLMTDRRIRKIERAVNVERVNTGRRTIEHEA